MIEDNNVLRQLYPDFFMETTLELRWFVKGTPPEEIQRWFRWECPGKLLKAEPEIREDLYTSLKPLNLSQLPLVSTHISDREAINLKFRQGSLELKLRQQQLGTQQFDNLQNSGVWTGNIEQWHKFNESKLLSIANSIPKTNWISVYKKRLQKIERDVKSELTHLKTGDRSWWSLAFEMNYSNDSEQHECFQEVIERSCQTYCGAKLPAESSYGYSRWLLLLDGKAIDY